MAEPSEKLTVETLRLLAHVSSQDLSLQRLEELLPQMQALQEQIARLHEVEPWESEVVLQVPLRGR